MGDDDFLKKLKDSDPDVQYPRDLRTATRAEFKTLIRKNRKPGCPLMGGSILALIGLIKLLFHLFS